MSAQPATSSLEHLPWSEAVRRMAWQQGEHTTLVGSTGSGKTELMIELMRHRNWCLFLNTKRIDDTQRVLKSELGFHSTSDPGAIQPEVHNRFIIAPKWQSRHPGFLGIVWPWSPRIPSDELDARHRRVYVEALTRAFWQTGWTVGIDELEYINRDLKIEAPVNRLLRQGRSQGNSMILGTQRPRYVTLHAYEQADHLFLWKMADLSNAIRAAELAGVNRVAVMEAMPSLGKHDVLYVHKDSGEMFITNTRW